MYTQQVKKTPQVDIIAYIYQNVLARFDSSNYQIAFWCLDCKSNSVWLDSIVWTALIGL